MNTLDVPTRTLLILVIWIALCAAPASALDTTEPYTPGATDYEFTLGTNGLGTVDPVIVADTLLAFGIKPWLGLETQFVMEFDARLRTAVGTLASGLLFTPLDTEHFDVDVTTGVLIGGEGFNEARVNGLAEFNVDSDNDMSFIGGYVRVGIEFYNDRALDPTADESLEYLVPLEVGGYWSPVDGHQILFEYAAALSAELPSPNDVFNHGRVAVGYNVLFGEDFELVTQFGINVPQNGASTSASLLVGFIKVWDGRVTPPNDAQ